MAVVQEEREVKPELRIESREKDNGWEFDVRVREGREITAHVVTMAKDYFDKLAEGRTTPEEFIQDSFIFLLDREPKEHILGNFDISTLQEYFPEYEEEIQKLIA